ncbi:MAG TPA: cytochrome b/b6 domain-containing protein [Frateuria sp.]|uniref:cytochrome b n=1 Tax=Frateuria sp. TaxID=2211372 RepID=UPI002D7E481B|nr:cytochrome b/b6 domain-containing protein [Frateuria sp.]HET6806097.1 cytochrome b/b6 domain-containing protein [Frateuria sp.]
MNISGALKRQDAATHGDLKSKAPGRYPATVRVVHWLTVLAVAAAYALVQFGGEHAQTGVAPAPLQWHFLAGLVVLVLLAVRLPALAMARIPPIQPTPGRLTGSVARVTHLALYAFLLAQPVLGILQVNLAGDAVTLPGGWSLPALVHADHAWHERIGELHEELGEIFYWVIGLHVAAALWHHLVVRDNTLRRML